MWNCEFAQHELVTFGGRGKYEEPKVAWTRSAGLTSILFLGSDRLGSPYKNDMFVGDVHNGRIYHFKLNNERDDLLLPKSLEDKIIQDPVSVGADDIVFGDGFSGITDLTVGPDGYLYIVSIGQGKVYRILPK